MATIKKLNVPPIEFGHVPKFLDNYNLGLPTGKGYHLTARFNKPFYEYYIQQAGITTVQINSGSGVYDAVPRKNRNTIFHYGSVQTLGKTWAQYTTSDAEQLAEYNFNTLGGVNVVTSNLSETIGEFPRDNYVILYQTNPNAYVAYERKMDQLCADTGGNNFGAYGGIFTLLLNDSGDVSAFRNALQSTQNSLSYMRQRESADHPYFNVSGWQFQSPCLNHYFRGETDVHNRFIKMVGANQLVKNALKEVNASYRRVMGFFFPNKTEFVGYSELNKRDLGDGIRYEEYTFPNYSFSYRIDQGFFTLDMLDDYYGWEDSGLYGDNPAFSEPNIYRDGDNFPLGVQRNSNGDIVNAKPTATRQVLPDANRAFPYPCTMEGLSDMEHIGAWMYGRCCDYVGAVVQATWNKHRAPGLAWCSDGPGYLADRVDDRKPLVRVGRNGNKAWVKVVDNTTETEVNGPYNLEVDMGSNQTITVPVNACSNNLFLVDLS